MNREELVQRATAVARAKAPAASAKRLAAYQQALATLDEDPLCPDCWIGEEELAMAPIASDTPDEVQFGCMDCGFEVSFPARSTRHLAHPHRHGRGSRAA